MEFDYREPLLLKSISKGGYGTEVLLSPCVPLKNMQSLRKIPSTSSGLKMVVREVRCQGNSMYTYDIKSSQA